MKVSLKKILFISLTLLCSYFGYTQKYDFKFFENPKNKAPHFVWDFAFKQNVYNTFYNGGTGFSFEIGIWNIGKIFHPNFVFMPFGAIAPTWGCTRNVDFQNKLLDFQASGDVVLSDNFQSTELDEHFNMSGYFGLYFRPPLEYFPFFKLYYCYQSYNLLTSSSGVIVEGPGGSNLYLERNGFGVEMVTIKGLYKHSELLNRHSYLGYLSLYFESLDLYNGLKNGYYIEANPSNTFKDEINREIVFGVKVGIYWGLF